MFLVLLSAMMLLCEINLNAAPENVIFDH